MIKEKKAVEKTDEPFEENTTVESPKKTVDVEKFIARRLKVINEWPDGAKKRAAVERLFRNKEAKV